MSTLYNRISALCSQRGIKIGKMCSEIGISRGNLTDLKMERKSGLSPAALQKIAEFFNVSVDFLLTGENKNIPSNEQLMYGLLDGDTEGFTEEMLEEVKRFAKYVKSRGSF